MPLRIECGEHPNDGFKLLNAETGEDLTEVLLAKNIDVLVSLRPDQMNVARFEVYVEGLDVLVDKVEAKVVNPGTTRGDLPWKDFDLDDIKEEVHRMGSMLARMSLAFDGLALTVKEFFTPKKDKTDD